MFEAEKVILCSSAFFELHAPKNLQTKTIIVCYNVHWGEKRGKYDEEHSREIEEEKKERFIVFLLQRVSRWGQQIKYLLPYFN